MRPPTTPRTAPSPARVCSTPAANPPAMATGIVKTRYRAALTPSTSPQTAPKSAGVWTASFGFPLIGHLGAAVEMFGYPHTTGPLGGKGIAALLIGPTFLARDWLTFDAGIVAPMVGPQPRAIYAGLVWNLGCFAGPKICR